MSRSGSRPVHWSGEGDGEALLLLNGWSASGLAWPKTWVHQLAQRYRVIRVDNRGSGWSKATSRPFTIGDLADDVHGVLAAVGVARARVLGLSMGGMIAQELAMRHPGSVTSLVLAGTRPPAPAGTTGGYLRLLEAVRPPAVGQSLSDYFMQMWSGFAAPGFAEENPEVMRELVEQIVRCPTPRNGVMDQVRAMASWHGARRLTRLAVPTTVVHGTEDPLIAVENGRRIAALIPGARLVELDGIGHLVPHEAGEALTAAIDSCHRSPSGG